MVHLFIHTTPSPRTGRWLLIGEHIVRDIRALCDSRRTSRGYTQKLELGAGFYGPSSDPFKLRLTARMSDELVRA